MSHGGAVAQRDGARTEQGRVAGVVEVHRAVRHQTVVLVRHRGDHLDVIAFADVVADHGQRNAGRGRFGRVDRVGGVDFRRADRVAGGGDHAGRASRAAHDVASGGVAASGRALGNEAQRQRAADREADNGVVGNRVAAGVADARGDHDHIAVLDGAVAGADLDAVRSADLGADRHGRGGAHVAGADDHVVHPGGHLVGLSAAGGHGDHAVGDGGREAVRVDAGHQVAGQGQHVAGRVHRACHFDHGHALAELLEHAVGGAEGQFSQVAQDGDAGGSAVAFAVHADDGGADADRAGAFVAGHGAQRLLGGHAGVLRATVDRDNHGGNGVVVAGVAEVIHRGDGVVERRARLNRLGSADGD